MEEEKVHKNRVTYVEMYDWLSSTDTDVTRDWGKPSRWRNTHSV